MANSELDFQLLVDRTIALTETCIAEVLVERENATNDLRITLGDLQRRGAPPRMLEKLEAFIRLVCPQKSRPPRSMDL